MNEDLNMVMEMTEDSMKHAIEHLVHELIKIRAGKASPAMLGGVMVDYYGAPTPLNQVANVGTSDARTITIQPWERKIIADIERAIINANLGFNPENNGEVIRVHVPPLTGERRKDLVKQVHAEAEKARISVRSARKSANDEFKRLQKDGLSEDLAKNGEADVQKLVEKYNKLVEEHVAQKEAEIMTV